jgi:hypothetical protein
LNKVRKRANLKNRESASKEKLREYIWQERHVELAMEHDRFFDLVRTGQAATVMKINQKNYVVGKHELLPIPALQIALSGNKLTQNNGY